MNEERTELYIRKDRGGTRRWYQWLAHLLRRKNWPGWIGSEDETCRVHCQCETELFVSSSGLTWCPTCHRGYMTELRVYCVPAWLYGLRRMAHVKPTPEFIAMMREAYKDYPALYKSFMDDLS